MSAWAAYQDPADGASATDLPPLLLWGPGLRPGCGQDVWTPPPPSRVLRMADSCTRPPSGAKGRCLWLWWPRGAGNTAAALGATEESRRQIPLLPASRMASEAT